ncbi:hypothetical protein [Flavobacterium wongokense]|uniref:hypothetical protein n=1 Tax=Flavobacterium wongokense TaxID=2910674 RepID=UPI001F399363|nr:hypothetical protein [Flavobacterium sp. WG47]MCF6130971.1 hypothetical protein [Flavobacterium sp. WG47]
MNDALTGVIFLVIGLALVSYVFDKRKKEKSINDMKGYIAGFGSIIFGIYLIIQAIIIKNKSEFKSDK